ncbi:MAG: plasmid mobilization relaxosome protein MobC [Oscillospiraceae bacterium]|nr:plasmid mobilization relaxosome protein MobC [Oscillospiraceae bacterium]
MNAGLRLLVRGFPPLKPRLERRKTVKKDSRKNYVQIRLNDEEKSALDRKFQLSGSQSKSRFIRLMILEGIIVHFDEEKFNKMVRDFTKAGSNINQIAVRVNSTGNIYADDVNQIRKEVEDLWRQLRYFQSQLQKLKP